MSNVSIGYAYSTDALLALQGKPFYNVNMGWGFQLLFTLSSQLIGIGLAGLCRRFLVWPSAMMWPNQFANTSLFYALHDKSKSDGVHSNGWVISRYRYFFYVFLGMFCYYWIPGVLWQGQSATPSYDHSQTAMRHHFDMLISQDCLYLPSSRGSDPTILSLISSLAVSLGYP